MTQVTDKGYYLDQRILDKIDLACQMIQNDNDDAILIITGGTGTGKTNVSKAYGYYIAQKLNRTFDNSRYFFEPEDWCKYVSHNRQQVVVWDEAALGCLSNQHAGKVQRTIVQILMMCRSRNHFLIFNIPKYKNVSKYLREECIGFINTYKNVELGKKSEYKYCYLNKSKKEFVNHQIEMRRHLNSYQKYSPLIDRSPSPDFFTDIIDDEKAERAKSDAIKKLGLSIGVGKILDKNYKKLKRLEKAIADDSRFSSKEKSKLLDLSVTTVNVLKKSDIDLELRKLNEKRTKIIV